MFDPEKLKLGMVVRSDEGEELGKIHSIGIASFLVEKGLFFREDSLLGYEDVQEIRDGEVILRHDTEALRGMSLLEGEEALAELNLHQARTIGTVASDEGFDPQPGAVHIGSKE
jgi:uncharacterized protein YrrD